MSANAQDFDFDEFDKPGAERSRRRRGEDDDLESDLEEDLLGEDWLSGKKNPSEGSDEELNDDLLQSDDEDVNMSGQDVSLNATYSLGTSYDQQDNLQEADYTDDVVNLGAEGCEEGDGGEEGYQGGEYTQEYSQDGNSEMPEDQMDYTGEVAEGDDGYQDEVLDIQINEPIDGEFQDDVYQTSYVDGRLGEHGVQQEAVPEEEQEEEGGEEQQEEEEEDTAKGFDTEEVENEAMPEEETKEESDEEDEEDEESGRLRFKSERKDGAVVRLANAGCSRRDIPETLELSEEAKQVLMAFEEQERQKKQNRYGGRGMRGGMRGGRGRGSFPPYGMGDFRGGYRGRMNDQRLPLMGNMGMQQPSSRMPLPHQPHQQQMHSQQHHPSRPRGPPPFQDHGRPLVQQPLQPLIPPHMAHRSPPLRPQMEPPPRMMSSPPPNFPQHHQQQPPQPKNIHINPHFRGPTSSSVQVPLMPPAQSQPRPAVGPQRFPGPGDFQQHMSGNFGQPQRPPHHMEPFRNQPPQGPQDREPLFMGEHTESARFPGQHMFDHQGPTPLMNSSHNLHQQQQMPGQGQMGFGPPGPAFNQPGQGPLGLFQREPPRPNLPPHQGHQGMVGLNQQGGPPNQPRPFMGPRQPFGQQGNLFPPPQVPFGMQVRLRGLMHGPPVNQLPHHDMPPHQPMHQQQQQHHRQDLPHHQQQHLNVSEPRPMMHHGQNPFHQQQAHGSPRQMTPRPQNPQQRNMSNRQRMSTPVSKQMQQRNSNLRELPVAPGNMNMNSARPAANVRPVAKATQGARPGQSTQLVPDGGRGRGQVAAKIESQPGEAGRTVVRKEIASTPSSTAPQDPDEDEETRQYRLKLEEQKRLREEILKRKEMRRQMQAGVRKKELLDRLNAQTPGQGQAPPQIQSSQQNQQMPHPVQQQQPPPPLQPQQQRQEQKQPLQPQPQPQQQRPQRAQQSLNQSLNNPNQATPIPPNGSPQIPTPRPNVKTRLQMVKGSTQLQQTPGPGPNQQWKPPLQQNRQQLQQQQQQQRRNSAGQNLNRPGSLIQPDQGPPKNIPVTPSVGPGQAQAQTQGPKLGAKRTVMQRAKNPSFEGQVPQKVRVVKLSGASGKGPVPASSPVQQQGTWPATPLNQRKVTMTGQQQQGPGGTPQVGRGVMGNPQQNRVVVSGRGRGRGGGPMGRGRPVSTRQSQRGTESERCTVSIEGLSSSTTDVQLQNLLRSIGPIEMFKMMPQQRKAIAKFSSPQHAASFQMSFHRHMIDLSHIDVSLIDG
ncbi:RNA-binding protein 33 isoform X1 [Epinephelus fuscoguttatus]|uniref:RNA-binding protein 33 isoform X1 n=1 Tax=Epinephelus fuscoguttatus TaxID=293821 RepID=UPI0020D1B220|nr:RNA-binding protein 33 isoform X1 [Epinephelus fuscoguttatus]